MEHKKPKKELHPGAQDAKEQENQRIIDSYDYLANAASSQDCTGLIPSEPMSDAERESYQDLYAYQYLPPKFPPEK